MQERLLSVDTALLTARTVVRRFRENDGEVVFELLNNNISWLSDYHAEKVKHIKTIKDAEFFVRNKFASWLLQVEFSFGVWDKETAQLIGFIRFFDIDWNLPKAQTEFLIDKSFSGQGIMTEALYTTLEFAFQQLQMEKIFFTTLSDDYNGQRLVRKCGFRREGDLRSHYRLKSGDLADLMLLALTRPEFVKV